MKKFTLPKLEDEKSTMKSVRLRSSLLKVIEEVSIKTGLSVNKVINLCIEYALLNLEDLDVPIDSLDKIKSSTVQ